MTLKAALVLAAAGILALILRRASAAGRHLVWLLAVIATLVTPAVVLVIPGWRLGVLPEATSRPQWAGSRDVGAAVAARRPGRLGAETAAEGAASSALSSRSGGSDGHDANPFPAFGQGGRERPGGMYFAAELARSRLLGWLPALWLAGVLVALARVVVGLLAAARLARSATPAADPAWLRLVRDASRDLGLARPVRLLFAPRRGAGRPVMPMTFGVFRPVLLLPAEADDWPAGRRRVVVLHELAHVRRHDCLTQLVAHVACAVHWFNPLIWLAARQLRAERERACDDLVLLAGSPPADYAGHLLTIARTAWAWRPVGVAAVAMARRSQLEGRLRAVLDRTRRRAGPRKAAQWAAAAVAAVVVLPLAAVRVGRVAGAADRDATPAARPVGPYAAALPGGGTVELLAVSAHPSRGDSWWSPAGDRLVGGFVTRIDGQRGEAGKTQAVEFVARLTGLPAGSSAWPRWQAPDVPLAYAGGDAGPGGQIDPRYRAAAAVLPVDLTRVTLRVGIATGAWRTLAEAPAAEGGARTVADDAAAAADRRRLAELEKELGLDRLTSGTGGWQTPMSKADQEMDRHLQELARIRTEVSGYESRLETITSELKDGRTPAEVEAQINNSSRYAAARQRLDDLDAELDQLRRTLGPGHERVVQAKARREALAKSLDKTREELKAPLAEAMTALLRNQIQAGRANAERVERAIEKASGRLGDANKKLAEYRQLKDARGAAGTGVSFARAVESGGDTVVSVAHAVTGADVRVIGVDPAGREMLPGGVDTRDVNGVAQTTATFAATTPAAIRTVRLQSRPFAWVEFRDVALSPSARAGDAEGPGGPGAAATRADARPADTTAAENLWEMRARDEQLLVLEQALRDSEEMLAQAEEDLKAADGRKLTVEDWARVDETISKHVQMRNELRLRIDSLESQLGPNHPAVINARKDLAAREATIQAAADKLAAQFVIRWKADGTGGLLIPRDLTAMREALARMQSLYKKETKKVEELRAAAAQNAAEREKVEFKKAKADPDAGRLK